MNECTTVNCSYTGFGYTGFLIYWTKILSPSQSSITAIACITLQSGHSGILSLINYKFSYVSIWNSAIFHHKIFRHKSLLPKKIYQIGSRLLCEVDISLTHTIVSEYFWYQFLVNPLSCLHFCPRKVIAEICFKKSFEESLCCRFSFYWCMVVFLYVKTPHLLFRNAENTDLGRFPINRFSDWRLLLLLRKPDTKILNIKSRMNGKQHFTPTYVTQTKVLLCVRQTLLRSTVAFQCS